MADRDASQNRTEGSGATGAGYNRPASGGDVSGATTSTSTYSPHAEGSGATETGEQSGGMKETVTGAAASARDSVTGAAGTAKDKATELAGTARDKASDVMGGATESIGAQKDTVAGGLDTVASTLRDRAEQIPGGERTTQIAQTAAERIEGASGYIREREVGDMMTDVEGFVRSHPTESLVIALAAGFLLGRAVRG